MVDSRHDHAVLGWYHARHLDPLDRPLNEFHRAEPAGTDAAESFVIAEVGDDDPNLFRGFQHVGPGGDFNGYVVDDEFWH